MVRNAKRQFWADKVDKANTDRKAFALAAWAKPKPPEARGPITHNAETAVTERDKLQLLFRSHILREGETTTPNQPA